MDPELSVLRLKKEAIRLKLKSIKSKLEAIDSELEAVDAEEAEESHPGNAPPSFEGTDASGEDSMVGEQPASVAALTSKQREDNFMINLYPKWMMDIRYYEGYVIRDIAHRFESDEPTMVDVPSPLEDHSEKRAYGALGGGTVLHWAIRMKDPAEVTRILAAGGALGGGTALHFAVRMEDPAAVTRILAAGEVDVNARDEYWRATALHWAARIGNMAIVTAMLTNHLASGRFDLSIRDRWSTTALECAIFSGAKPNISMVTELLKFKDSNHGYDDKTLGVIEEVEKILQEGGPNIEVESRFISQRETLYNKVRKEGTYLHWAVRMEDAALAAYILEGGGIDVNALDHAITGLTALLLAVKLRNLDIVKLMVTEHLKSRNFNVNYADWRGYTALHWAILSGENENMSMVIELLRCEATMRLTEECNSGKTPLQIAHERGFKDIQKVLMEHEVVRRYVEDLYRDRQVYVDAANAILVGAALIASVTFASWLQPPLGYTPDYVNVQQNMGLRAFWVFNCLSFYCAIATVVFGARSVLPRSPYFIKQTVEKLRKNLLMTTILLACSVFFVVVAFGIAGCIVLTPVGKFQLVMIIPTLFGGLVCLISLGLLSYSMWEDSLGREHVARRRHDWSKFVRYNYTNYCI